MTRLVMARGMAPTNKRVTPQVPYQFLVMAVLFFWYVVRADDLASQNPRSSQHDYDGGDNSILRFGVATMLFTCLYVGVWLYHKVSDPRLVFSTASHSYPTKGGAECALQLADFSTPVSRQAHTTVLFVRSFCAVLTSAPPQLIYVRLIDDPYGSFQDLCSLSNISVLVLTNDCRGFYLHGMSPHGPAEVSLLKMTKQLEEEADDLGKRRGLVENSDDQVCDL